jgi:hypothetical protein
LRDALGDIGHAAIIPDQKLDLLAGNRIAMLLNVKLRACGHLLANGRDLAGHRQDETHIDSVLRGGSPGRKHGGSACRKSTGEIVAHRSLPAWPA